MGVGLEKVRAMIGSAHDPEKSASGLRDDLMPEVRGEIKPSDPHKQRGAREVPDWSFDDKKMAPFESARSDYRERARLFTELAREGLGS